MRRWSYKLFRNTAIRLIISPYKHVLYIDSASFISANRYFHLLDFPAKLFKNSRSRLVSLHRRHLFGDVIRIHARSDSRPRVDKGQTQIATWMRVNAETRRKFRRHRTGGISVIEFEPTACPNGKVRAENRRAKATGGERRRQTEAHREGKKRTYVRGNRLLLG